MQGQTRRKTGTQPPISRHNSRVVETSELLARSRHRADMCRQVIAMFRFAPGLWTSRLPGLVN
jgi:hypothetical protein